VTYAFVFDLPGPLEQYQAAHTEFNKYPTDDLLVHIGRPTGDGVQVVEVWTSEEAFQGWMGTGGVAAVGALAAAGGRCRRWLPPRSTRQGWSCRRPASPCEPQAASRPGRGW
jgi:hypothetical protein